MSVLRDDLIVNKVEGEYVVLDRRSDSAHLLNPSVSRVFDQLSSEENVEFREEHAGLFPEFSFGEAEAMWSEAISVLVEKKLLVDVSGTPMPAGVSRRDFLSRVGMAGALLPAIATVGMPHPAAAQSCVSYTIDNIPLSAASAGSFRNSCQLQEGMTLVENICVPSTASDVTITFQGVIDDVLAVEGPIGSITYTYNAQIAAGTAAGPGSSTTCRCRGIMANPTQTSNGGTRSLVLDGVVAIPAMGESRFNISFTHCDLFSPVRSVPTVTISIV